MPDARVSRGSFTAIALDGEPALRLQTANSYGMLLHELRTPQAGWLQWQWRLDEALTQADIRQRSADDAALMVCAMFDQPLGDMPFRESLALRLARAASAQAQGIYIKTAWMCPHSALIQPEHSLNTA